MHAAFLEMRFQKVNFKRCMFTKEIYEKRIKFVCIINISKYEQAYFECNIDWILSRYKDLHHTLSLVCSHADRTTLPYNFSFLTTKACFQPKLIHLLLVHSWSSNQTVESSINYWKTKDLSSSSHIYISKQERLIFWKIRITLDCIDASSVATFQSLKIRRNWSS